MPKSAQPRVKATHGPVVAYYRVSTEKQGRSGLGLEAQKAAVKAYLNGGNWHFSGEFVEIESGKQDKRPELAKALAHARMYRAPLVVAKVDRLTRSAAFLGQLLAAGVDVRFADLPQIEGPTGKFILQQMASVAELEAGLISKRTREALAAAKARGKKLGGSRGAVLSESARAAGRAVVATNAKQRAADLAPLLRDLQRRGQTSLRQIAAGLMAAKVPTATGATHWSPVQVSRALSRMERG